MIKFNGALLRYKSGKHWEKKLFLKKYFNFSWQSNENDCHWYWSLHWFFVICFELSCFIVKKNYFFFRVQHFLCSTWRRHCDVVGSGPFITTYASLSDSSYSLISYARRALHSGASRSCTVVVVEAVGAMFRHSGAHLNVLKSMGWPPAHLTPPPSALMHGALIFIYSWPFHLAAFVWRSVLASLWRAEHTLGINRAAFT